MYSLVLLNGGFGTRVAADQPKQLLKVNGIPILIYSLVAADAVPEIDQIVINYPEGWRDAVKEIIDAYAISTPVDYIPAGTTRHESVALMLDSCSNEQVIIHETARPLVTTADFRTLIDSEHANVSLMLPIPFTVAPVDPVLKKVSGYLERDNLRNVQLPQKFDLAVLRAGHDYALKAGVTFTEDATLCAVSGADVRYIDGNDRNIKVTTPTDVRLAGFLLSRPESRDD